METSHGFRNSQIEHQPRHHHHHRFFSGPLSHGPLNPPQNHQHIASLPALPLLSPLSPQHRQLTSRKQLLWPASDEDHAARATSDGGLGITRAGAAPAPPVAQATSPPDGWPRRQQLPAGASIYTPPHHALRKHTLPSIHQHHRSLSHASSQPFSINKNHHKSTTSTSTTRPFTRNHNSLSHQHQHSENSNEYCWQPRTHLHEAVDFYQPHANSHQDVATGKDFQCLSHHNSNVVVMEPSSPKSPSTALTMSFPSGSSGKSASNTQVNPPPQTQSAIPNQGQVSQLCECSEPTASPQSLGPSTGSDSESLPTSPPEQTKDLLRQELLQTVPTTPFRFPGSRRNSSGNRSTALAQQPQQQQTHVALEPSNNHSGFLAYCFDRGNGLYTRLVPADTLPPSAGYSALQSGSNGMIVLQDPLTQPFSGYGALSTQQPSFGANMLAHTGAIVQRSGPGNINSGSNGASTKKNKVYCDKWVHEGICAFTQQGCKFKHEMPHDRSIQRSLGLFHGYPSWYKKQQAQEQQAREQQPPVTMDAAVPGLQSLPALPAQQQQQQACSSFAPRTAAFVPSLSSIHSGFSCPVSILAVPAAPPPTPVPQQRTMQHAGLFQTSGFYPDFGSNGNSMTGNRMRGGSGSSNGMDSPWRASGVNASSWRTPQPATSTAEHVFGDGSTGQLTDSFARNLSFGEQPLSRVYQSQQLHQQQPAPTPSETGEQLYSGVGSAYPLGFGIGLKSGGNCLGSLGAVDSQANAGGRSSFGPIGPPTRVVAQETTLSTAFAYHGSQDHAHDEQPGDDTGDHSTTKW